MKSRLFVIICALVVATVLGGCRNTTSKRIIYTQPTVAGTPGCCGNQQPVAPVQVGTPPPGQYP